MNLLDMVMLFILGFCLIRGFFRGIIKEVTSIFGVFLGFFAARMFYMDVAAFLAGWVENSAYRDIVAFLVVFIGVFLLITVVGVVLRYLMKMAFLGWVDRLFGVGIGLVKGILLVSVLLLALTTFLPKGSAILERSTLSPQVNRVSEYMAGWVSKEMKNTFNEKVQELKKSWKRLS